MDPLSNTVLRRVIFGLMLMAGSATSLAQHTELLWYRSPAKSWTEALPVGNGFIGAMIYGAVKDDRIQFNESTFWSGGPRGYARRGAVNYLPEIRQLLDAGKQREAEELAEKYFMGLKYRADGYEEARAHWRQRVFADSMAAAPGFNDRNWATMTIPTPQGWEAAGFEGLDGSVWFRTDVEIPKRLSTKEFVLDLGKIRDEDVTWINGRKLGSVNDPNATRRYIVPSGILKAGKNIIAIQVLNYYDKGGFTGRKGKEPFFYLVSKDGDTIFLKRTLRYQIRNAEPPMMPRYNADYLPFADLHIVSQFPPNNIKDYRRSLDISKAVSEVEFSDGDNRYKREYFVSYPRKVMAIRYTSSGKSMNLSAFFKSPHQTYSFKKIDDQTISIFQKPRNGELTASAFLRVDAARGKVQVTDSSLEVSGADTVCFYLAAATSYENYRTVDADPVARCREIFGKSLPAPFQQILDEHIQDYQNIYNRFALQLGNGKGSDFPTDERIRNYSVQKDPDLLALYVRYGRYLLISSSRPGAQPANLQGIWNAQLLPPWGSKYTTNINVEMNYWPSEILNMTELNEPLFRMIAELSETGKETAREHYGAPGWVLHHNTDLWRGTAPVNAANHGIWPTGSGWLCRHLWEHFLFNQDTAFLRNTAFPIMKAAAEFYEHVLVEDKKSGFLISSPSNSPEQGGLVAGPTMDHQIIRELFRNCIQASEILGTEAAQRQKWQEKIARIMPNKIGRYGQLQEWMEDKDDTTNRHRHVSHLWGVFPGNDIPAGEAALRKAAEQSLIFRGDDGTGWSLAWKVNLWARLGDGDHALKVMNRLLEPAITETGTERGGVYVNLFDAHPPFQIDGNFGGAAGIVEMLIQSHDGIVRILPALPKALPDGEIRGVRARGNLELDFSWKNGRVVYLKVRAGQDGEVRLEYNGIKKSFFAEKGKSYPFEK